MTPQEIRQFVHADVTLRTLATQGADNVLASRLPIVTEMNEDFRLTKGGIMNLFGAVRGAAILTKMRALTGSLAPTVKELMPLIDGEGVRLTNSDATTIFNGLVSAGVCTVPEVAQVTAQMNRTRQHTANEVSEALLPWRPDGICGAIPATP